jgi:hypothetical protein
LLHTPLVRRGIRVVLLLITAFLGARCQGLDDREYACELAIAQLIDCCPGFPVDRLACTSAFVACNGPVSDRPSLTLDESKCIFGLDCRTIEARDLCKRVPALPPAIHEECVTPPGDFGNSWFGPPRTCTYTDVSRTRGPVCP